MGGGRPGRQDATMTGGMKRVTLYVAAYDTENPRCLAGVREIVKQHEAHEMPATFFIVAKVFEENRAEYLALLRDHPLFEIGSHSYTHMVLRETSEYGQVGPVEQFPKEIVESKNVLEDGFGCEVMGFRTPVGSVDGLKQAPEALKLLDAADYRYVSSLAWGPCWTLPALLVAPFPYTEEGYPDLWELPSCGWHENLLKGNNECGPRRLGLFPHPMPDSMPTDYVKSADEEFAVNNKPFIDRAMADTMPLVSLIWHPWSLHRFDPEMQMLDMTFRYVREKGLSAGTFSDALTAVS